ncbi:putative glycosyltransferase [Fundidesulfovibrio magnetotacticus]|uniref:Putative glycosyltransferase n=1 Tax=Fundidesulfovibrio magnetotacticus TaxID=2730080 RepID=A0A6V8LWI6_9BACT|nr:glycosyltransferase family 2 protein [Fundidesulfovibrio magnetotacticus]GFK92635.1 putative glycosyltransferase [Fundidesulfovibrio magnetotacticus]
MAALPTFTIVTPSFNQGRYLRRNLESVAGQQGVSVEHILLDGGSTDDTLDVIARHGGHLAHWRSAPDGGQTASLIEGFSRARGQVWGWLNSDDYLWDERALLHVAEAFAARPEAAMVSGDTVLVTEDERPAMLDMVPGPSARKMRYTMCVPQQSTFWRAEAYRAVGGIDPAFRYCMDFDLFQRMSQGRAMARVPRFVAAFRLQPASKTATWGDVYRREVALCQSRYGRGALHWLAVKAVTMELRLGSAAAELAALASGRKLPCLANCRWEPCRAFARKRHGLSF